MASRTVITVLLVLSILDVICEIKIGCRRWEAGDNGQVCCKECHTGNRRVFECGVDPDKLCTPCLNGTYTKIDSPWYCEKCNQCVEPQVVDSLCHGTTDTKCGCMKGYRCHTPECEQCEKECGKGEEPIKGRCPKCQHGYFNNKIHSKCIPWKSCPKGYVVETNGTTTTDVECGFSNEIEIVTQKPPGDNDQNKSMVWICMGSVVFFSCAVIIALLCQIKKYKPPIKIPVTELPTKIEPLSLMTVEQEECSFCQPQQEQGSSMESISTQDSLEKLLSPV